MIKLAIKASSGKPPVAASRRTKEPTASKGDELTRLKSTFSIGDLITLGVPRWKAKLQIPKWLEEQAIVVKKQGSRGIATIYEKT